MIAPCRCRSTRARFLARVEQFAVGECADGGVGRVSVVVIAVFTQ